MKAAFNILFLTSLLLASCQSSQDGLINGKPFPELALNGLNDDKIDVKELKGKLVLVDFWASWCKPCRVVNPELVRIYNKYNKAQFQGADGFEIYSISLDTDKDKWKKAISRDNLDWPYHVSELEGWKAGSIQQLDVRAIPASFLLDQNGVIIGKDLLYYDLEKLLEKRLALPAN